MTEPEVTEYLEIGQVDRVYRFRGWETEDGEDGNAFVTKRNQSRNDILPEDLMAKLEEHLGDALAKVTVGGELGHSKEYGCRAKAFVSISVHCNSDEQTIAAVKGLLQEKVRDYVNGDIVEMMEDRDRYMQQDKSGEGQGRVARQNPSQSRSNQTPTARPRSFRR